jgi:hypothetical protein
MSFGVFHSVVIILNQTQTKVKAILLSTAQTPYGLLTLVCIPVGLLIYSLL